MLLCYFKGSFSKHTIHNLHLNSHIAKKNLNRFINNLKYLKTSIKAKNVDTNIGFK